MWFPLRNPIGSPTSQLSPAAITSPIAGLEQENARFRAKTCRVEETDSEHKTILEDFAAVSAKPTTRTSRPPADQLRFVRRWVDAIESDTQAAERLRLLIRYGTADPTMLRVAVEAVARPPTNIAADVLSEMNLLANLAELLLAQQVEDAMEAAEEELAFRWLAEAGSQSRTDCSENAETLTLCYGSCGCVSF